MTRAVVVHADAADLARVTAARVLVHLVDLQSVRRPVHLALTGGRVGIATVAEMVASPLAGAVDWSGVHIWWGDERFVTTGDPDRNEQQALDVGLGGLPIPAAHHHPVPGPDTVATPEESAERYAAELAAFAPEGATVPALDLLLLGMGPDGHTASLFPGHPAVGITDRPTAAVHDSPKPPPLRVTLTFPTIRAARDVWVVAAGEDKRAATARALAGGDVVVTPAAGAIGSERTLWLIDAAAAG